MITKSPTLLQAEDLNVFKIKFHIFQLNGFDFQRDLFLPVRRSEQTPSVRKRDKWQGGWKATLDRNILAIAKRSEHFFKV